MLVTLTQKWRSESVWCECSCGFGQLLCGFVVFVLTVQFAFLHSHAITCQLSADMCTPVTALLSRFQEIPQPLSDWHSSAALMQVAKDVSANWQSENDSSDLTLLWKQCVSRNWYLSAGTGLTVVPSFALLLAQRRGGSTWTHRVLRTHSGVAMIGEHLMHWYNSRCSRFAHLAGSGQCDGHSLAARLRDGFRKALRVNGLCDADSLKMAKWRKEANDAKVLKRVVVAVNVQIEQLRAELYPAFVRFVAANDVSVIHMQRLSALSSLWSYSADEFERFQTGDVSKMLIRKREEKRQKMEVLPLEPLSAARRYAALIENKHGDLALLFEVVGAQLRVKYAKVSYEQLIGANASVAYWNSAQSFLGLPPAIDFSQWFQREHPQPCYQRISNWAAARHHFDDTLSVSACQKIYS